MKGFRWAAIALVTLALGEVVAAQAPALTRQQVSFTSGELTLVGYLFKPEGKGPFPALLWNHGSEQSPDAGPQFDSVAKIFVPAGYVVFAPMRRGHGTSQGSYIVDQLAQVRASQGIAAANELMVHLMETEQLHDQLAGLTVLQHLAYVDTTRLVVAGCSYGGIETLLAAEAAAGFKAAVAISPAALSWNGNPLLQQRLRQAAGRIGIPVFLIQPPKDASLEPSRVLGEEFRRRGASFTGRIYPAVGPENEQGHCFGGARGMHVWARDVLDFLQTVLR